MHLAHRFRVTIEICESSLVPFDWPAANGADDRFRHAPSNRSIAPRGWRRGATSNVSQRRLTLGDADSQSVVRRGKSSRVGDRLAGHSRQSRPGRRVARGSSPACFVRPATHLRTSRLPSIHNRLRPSTGRASSASILAAVRIGSDSASRSSIVVSNPRKMPRLPGSWRRRPRRIFHRALFETATSASGASAVRRRSLRR